MFDIVEVEEFTAIVQEMEPTDSLLAGSGGPMTVSAQALANRTKWLNANKANKGGDNTVLFKVAAATSSYDAVNKSQLDTKINSTEKGVANGVATLDGSGLVPSSQLPSFVDDVIEVATKSALPVTGETGKIYIVIADESNGGDTSSYRWTGSTYALVSNTLTAADILNLLNALSSIDFTRPINFDYMDGARTKLLTADTNLNTILTTGDYTFNVTNATTANTPTTGWFYVQSLRYNINDTYSMQILTTMNSGVLKRWVRQQRAGVWSAWQGLSGNEKAWTTVSRVSGTNYTNSNPYPITFKVKIDNTGTDIDLQLSTTGGSSRTVIRGTNLTLTLQIEVPSGANYSFLVATTTGTPTVASQEFK